MCPGNVIAMDVNVFASNCTLIESATGVRDHQCNNCATGYGGNHCDVCIDTYYGTPENKEVNVCMILNFNPLNTVIMI